MKAHTKTIAVIAAILLTLAVATGLRLVSLFRKPAPSTQATNPFGPFFQTGSASPNFNPVGVDQMAVYKLMSQYRLDIRSATYIAQAKIQLISETSRSVHYVLTFPDKVTSDETITITPGQRYTPTPAELQRPNRTGLQIFNPKLSVKKTGPDETRFTLQYYAPQSALPADLQQRIQEPSPSSRSSGTDFFTLVPSAWAQESGDNGAGSAFWNVAEIVKSMGVKGLEHAELEKSARVMDNLLTVKDVIKGYGEISGWLGEISELQDCAKHPTNPLTAKAAQGADYQQQVQGGLDDASWDIQMTAFPKVANITAGALTQFLPFGSGVLISPITAANDEAIDEIAEQRIADAKKSVTPCDHTPMTAGQFRPMKGTVEYLYNKATSSKGGTSEEIRKATGDFVLNPGPNGMGFLGGNGTGNLKIESKNTSATCNGKGQQTLTGALQVTAEAGGTPAAGVVKLSLGGDLLTGDATASATCGQPTTSSHWENGAFGGATCEFSNVDLVHGGTYSAFQKGEPHGTCKVEIAPQ